MEHFKTRDHFLITLWRSQGRARAYQNLSLCSSKEAGRLDIIFEHASFGSKDNLKNDRVGNKHDT